MVIIEKCAKFRQMVPNSGAPMEAERRQGLLAPLNASAAPPRRAGSTAMATVSLFKAVVGTGVFAYPPAVREAGWVLATAVASFFFVINLYTMAALNLSIVAMREKGFGADTDGRVEYHQLTAHIFSPAVNAAFLVVAVLGQVLTLASMTVFVVDQIVPLAPMLQEWQVALGMALVVAPLCCLRTTDALPFQVSMQVGSVAVLTGMVTLVWYGLGPHGGFDAAEIEEDTRVDFHGLATAFSISAMMYSAHMESVSIEQDMANRAVYLRTLVSTQVGIGLLYMSFGAVVFLFFGAATGRVCATEAASDDGGSLVCQHWCAPDLYPRSKITCCQRPACSCGMPTLASSVTAPQCPLDLCTADNARCVAHCDDDAGKKKRFFRTSRRVRFSRRSSLPWCVAQSPTTTLHLHLYHPYHSTRSPPMSNALRVLYTRSPRLGGSRACSQST